MSLDLQYKSEDSWTNCFSLTPDQASIAIPSVAYLGFSAETGELSDNHDIVSVKAENLYYVKGSLRDQASGGKDSSRGRGGSKAPQEKGSWIWFLFKVILFFGAIVGAYFGWTIYRTKARSSRF